MRLDVPNEIKMSLYYMINDAHDKAVNVLKNSKAAVSDKVGSYTKILDGYCSSCGQKKYKDVFIPYVNFMASQRKYVNNLEILLKQLKPKNRGKK